MSRAKAAAPESAAAKAAAAKAVRAVDLVLKKGALLQAVNTRLDEAYDAWTDNLAGAVATGKPISPARDKELWRAVDAAHNAAGKAGTAYVTAVKVSHALLEEARAARETC